MDTKSVGSFDLDGAWQSHLCNTVQEYLQDTYGRLEATGCAHAFRGVTRTFPNLRPSIDRREITGNPIEIETWLLEEFLRRAWNDLTPQERHRCLLAEAHRGHKRNTGTMVVARHRMVPTRCIDWTADPLCSLLFACESDPERDGEVWWFNSQEFEYCVGAQWPALFGKPGHVVDEIEQEFFAGNGAEWITAMYYMLLPDDRLDRQRAWITVAGCLGTCHAERIHRLGVREKGRLVIPAQLKTQAAAFLQQMEKSRETLGFAHGDPADETAAKIKDEFERKFPLRS